MPLKTGCLRASNVLGIYSTVHTFSGLHHTILSLFFVLFLKGQGPFFSVLIISRRTPDETVNSNNCFPCSLIYLETAILSFSLTNSFKISFLFKRGRVKQYAFTYLQAIICNKRSRHSIYHYYQFPI